ncbi:MAG: carbamate kinase [Oscillospiraceae bacterium]|nr:carbamate kinase [Oscillospiraceae bacterium]
MSKRIVIALGGNALGSTPARQLELVEHTARVIVRLIRQGNEVILSHGNGPQVGMIHLGLGTAAEAGAIAADMPFPECGAMSQGYIGYHLQQAIGNELAAQQTDKPVVTVVTQTVVDGADPAFQAPTKPVGAFYDAETARRLQRERGYTMVEDAGRGYRRVVPSPRPVDIVEAPSIRALVEAGHVVVAVGGGGVPVIRENGALRGVAAVIDKDLGSELLAELLGSDTLVILTAVEQASLYYGTPQQQPLGRITAQQALSYAQAGHFAKGSMLPKIEAAARFAASAPGRQALITSLERAAEGLAGQTGTLICG